ncbi:MULTISPECIES: hypothetical protein [Bacillaceae]|uniref:Uncharacterized protein n=1 Tax=Evansella alkalicola TaxID=745819 RepID=A0ABS6JRS8_9BACI|nr:MULTISPECIES: hypothetical protein [Bacillaceae]MBU9719880.1 hypothetical protein [Bacillus alkalicola]
MKWTFYILLVVTALLISSSFFRWSEIETTDVLPRNTTLYYKQDNWVGQPWVAHCGGVGMCSRLKETPLVTEEDRHSSYSHVMQDHNKHARSGFMVEAWRERDRATYIWINLTAISFIGTIISFIYTKKRNSLVKNQN